ncbi:MAG TPA: gliding motility protein GldL [Bacteroidales bacterium]|jgi:gliding motility-associated protein GldL|nr:gliding motility protein GldL [Bacteroidales bacterium]
MINISELVQGSGWKKFMAKLYGWGAAVVILGALFKINHWPMATLMLIIGMGTEVIIFFFSAFEPMHEEVDWTLVYPELAGISEDEEFTPMARQEKSSGGGFSKLDEMLENADIKPELFEKLGKGLKNLNQTTQNLMNVSDASMATNQFIDNIQAASESVSSMTESYGKSAGQLSNSVETLVDTYKKSSEMLDESSKNVAEQFAQASDGFLTNYKGIEERIQANIEMISNGNQTYNEKLESLNKNMSALNSVYELQMQNTNDHLKTSKNLFDELDGIMSNLKGSVEETNVYREEIAKLNNNLAALNNVYGNMLSAMNVTHK